MEKWVQRFLISRRFTSTFLGQLGADCSRDLFWFLIPIIAVAGLEASPGQMGYLFVLRDIPVILFSLLMGVAFDRLSVKQLMILSSCLFAVLLFISGLGFAIGIKSMAWLYGLAFCAGTVMVFFDIGITTLLPAVVQRGELVRANSRMMIGRSVSTTLTPAFGGLMTRIVSPPILLAAGGLASLMGLWAFSRLPETPPRHSDNERKTLVGFVREVRSGFSVLFEVRVLRAVILTSCAGSFGFGAISALTIFTLNREFGFEPYSVGLILSAASAAHLLGSALCSRVTYRFGEGRTMLIGNGLAGIGYIGFASSAFLGSPGVGVASLLVAGLGAPLYAISQISIRQAITPHHLMGRANATRRFIVFSFLPIGALTAGSVAEVASTGAALLLGGIGMGLALLIGLSSPLRLRRIPGVILQ